MNGSAACPECVQIALHGPGTRLTRSVGALVYGVAAAAVAALVWWGIRALTGYELGIIAIGVGFLVGMAVRMGSSGRGGLAY